MPATTDTPGSFLGRISIRRNQIASMDGNHEQDMEDLETFQKHVADRFSDLLLSASDASSAAAAAADASLDPLLSIAWLRKLLDFFLCCEAEFKVLVFMGRDPSHIVRPPLDRLIPELLERVVKALDICNAVTHGVESIRHWHKLAEIAVTAFEQRPIGEGQVRRAKKALTSLVAALTLEDKESSSSKATERAWSFGRRGAKDRPIGHFRSLSWNVSKSWSAAKQIQSMLGNISAPRGADSTGLASPVFMMSIVLSFVTWILVAAIPCQERNGLPTHFPIPRQLPWAPSIIALQERIGEEWKKKEKKGSAGLLDEMQKMEKLGLSLIEFADSFNSSTEPERVDEVAAQVAELADTCRKMEEGLCPLQQQIREVFHRMVRSRGEMLDILDQAGKVATPMM